MNESDTAVASGNAEIDAAVRTARDAIASTASLDALDQVRATHLGKRSAIAAVQRTLGRLADDERRRLGAAINRARAELARLEAERRAELEAERDAMVLAQEAVDVTLPARIPRRGSLHPITETTEAIVDALVGLGYQVLDSPEVETDWHNFTALNTPEGHPARSSSDNFYVTGRPDRLLRSQTSPVQVRVMQEQRPPLYLVAPGFVYRRDDVDATHSPMFQQMEGLAVDEGLTMAHLKGTMLHFARELLGADREIVLHPHFFPFTEPSVDVQVSYVDKAGQAGWLELAGAGMVDPNVLSACGIDPERSTGFAFGWGLDRIAMIRFGVPDLRLFHENDLRFLELFA